MAKERLKMSDLNGTRSLTSAMLVQCSTSSTIRQTPSWPDSSTGRAFNIPYYSEMADMLARIETSTSTYLVSVS